MRFIKGMDVSMTKELEAYGAAYYLNGKREDLFYILKYYGVNMIRLRVWVDPYDENGKAYGGGQNDLETTIGLAKRVQGNGMGLWVDFHYSDFWADPGRQTKPKAWEKLHGGELETAVYLHTQNVLKTLKNHGIFPEMIQIGNEITNGLLWPDGHLGISDVSERSFEGTEEEHAQQMAGLLKAGIAAARQESAQAKIVLHLDFGTDNEMYRKWFERMQPYALDYDVIGMSYYPQWNGTLDELIYNMDDISSCYGKDVLIAETAIGYTTDSLGCRGISFTAESAARTGYPATQEGQENFLRDLCRTVREVKGGKGIGVCYWEPAWLPIQGCNWATSSGSAYMNDLAEAGNDMANKAMFDRNGYPNKALIHMVEM